MDRIFYGLFIFGRGLVVGFVIIFALLAAVLLPFIGMQAGPLTFVTGMAAFLAVLVGFQEVLGSGPGPSEEDRRRSWAPQSRWSLGGKTFLMSTIATFVFNLVAWSVFWKVTSMDVVAHVELNLPIFAIFSLAVGAFYGVYRIVRY